jgi:hypothetical protein
LSKRFALTGAKKPRRSGAGTTGFSNAMGQGQFFFTTRAPCRKIALSVGVCKAVRIMPQSRRQGRLYYATYEAKASEESRTGGWSRRRIFVAGGRGVRHARSLRARVVDGPTMC